MSLVFPAEDFLIDGLDLLLYFPLCLIAKLHICTITLSNYWYLLAAALPYSANLATSLSSRYARSLAYFPSRRSYSISVWALTSFRASSLPSLSNSLLAATSFDLSWCNLSKSSFLFSIAVFRLARKERSLSLGDLGCR